MASRVVARNRLGTGDDADTSCAFSNRGENDAARTLS